MIVKNQNEKMMKKEENIRKSDAVANRLYILFFAALAAVFAIIKVGNSIDMYLKYVYELKPFFLIGAGVVLILAIVYRFICYKREKDERFVTFASSYLLLIAVSLFCIVALFGSVLARDLLALVIIGAVLFFIYNIYEREFFWYSLYTAVGYLIFDIKFSPSLSVTQIIVSAAAVLFALAVVLAVVMAKQKRGKLVLFGKTVGTVSEKGIYAFIINSAIIIAATVLALFIAGISAYSIMVLFVSYMIFAVIYTLKMM